VGTGGLVGRIRTDKRRTLMGSINVAGTRQFLTVANVAEASVGVALALCAGDDLTACTCESATQVDPQCQVAGSGFRAAAQVSTGIDSRYSAAATTHTRPTKCGLLQK
jgi:hypothetical protein